MDWSKAKTVLIIAFIITNIFLGFKIQQNTYRASNFSKVSREYVQEIKSLLSHKDIAVMGDIPRDIVTKGNLTVEYRVIDKEKIIRVLMDDGSIDKASTQDIEIYKSGTKQLRITKEKKIEYRDYRDIKPIDATQIKDAKGKALELIPSLGWPEKELVFKEQKTENGVTTLYFGQRLKDRFIDGGSEIKLEMDGKGIVSYQSLWFDVVSEAKGKVSIIPATEAVLNLITLGKAIVVEDISLGYYIPTDIGHFKGSGVGYDNWEDIYQNQAIPAWRLTLSTGQRIYIDGYSGKPIN